MDERTCARCHGAQRPWDELVDRDGDGTAGTLEVELDRALSRARRELGRAIAARDLRERCGDRAGARARGFTDVGGVAWLVDAQGRLLGDCDASGVLDPWEQGVDTRALPADLAARIDAATLVARDGSRGVHNPWLVFRALAGSQTEARTGVARSVH